MTRLQILILVFASLFTLRMNAGVPQDSTGFPGDNFSLEGALELFKNAKSPEDFEKKLNDPDNYVNNLDLNEDGKVDYVRVEDYMDDKAHALVLQVALNENETQDVAVIEIEKTGEKEAIAQIVGDSTVYGTAKIVEPTEVVETQGDGSGPDGSLHIERIVINVWLWPSVRFVYAPVYRPWRSPWRWAVYPVWWRPWRPHPWHVFYPRVRVYHVHYRVAPRHRVVHAHRVYTPRRRTSVTVTKRTTVIKTRRRNNHIAGKKTTTKIGVKKQNGKVVVGKQKTTTRSARVNGKKVTKTNTTTKKVSVNNRGKVTKTKKKTKSTSVTRRNKNGGKTTVKKTTTKKVTKTRRRHR